MDSKERVFLLESRVGYFDIMKTFDHLFDGVVRFKGYIRGTVFENNAFQKVLGPLLYRERDQRRIHINPIPHSASTDKIARIRTTIGRLLIGGKLYVIEGQGRELIEEQKMFPQSKKVDTLDMLQLGISKLRRPLTEEEESEVSEQDSYFDNAERSSVTGY